MMMVVVVVVVVVVVAVVMVDRSEGERKHERARTTGLDHGWTMYLDMDDAPTSVMCWHGWAAVGCEAALEVDKAEGAELPLAVLVRVVAA
ncbi:hypothetical protein GGTG_08315 [Gaeumannomyces tritici R3-111a-1]|uniref:Secreted protein n=1 Tax=Gaeumannomyces tritici (strain R3-111a-1) TaxID=644352 RepID=J3P479_GAET3|nr:hypothetical protein GGTG_08315 [Gaeumannomyces tritici R3-111a-1]EJT74475.1 hypothetical protein GGTG_08315 [Gaeumannomyces tritici R3-111a-1]